MKELDFIEIIKATMSKSAHIGDDCAYLKELEIVITQDNLVEDIHFSRNFSTPFQIAHKAIMVNLSDIFASGAAPKYITIALSLPEDVDSAFIKEFYKACEELSKEFDFEIVGGDITGAEKVFVSICAIGSTKNRKISSRKNAKTGDYIITTGFHGSSAAGLWLLENGIKDYPKLNKAHIMPVAQKTLSKQIATKINTDYAMMDTSDGLADALFKMAQASNVTLSVDFDKIPYDKNIEDVALRANKDFKDWIFYGGEDFQLVACIDEKSLEKLDKDTYEIIGRVKKLEDSYVEINLGNKIEKINNLEKTFNHFRHGGDK